MPQMRQGASEMAASAWKVYNEAKKYLINGGVDLDTAEMRIKLVKGTSAAAVSNFTRSTFASCGTGVGLSGTTTFKALANVSVRMSDTSAAVFDFDALIITLSGAATSVQYAVIGVSGSYAIAWSKLSSAAFDLGAGATVTITPNTYVFKLTGGTT